MSARGYWIDVMVILCGDVLMETRIAAILSQ